MMAGIINPEILTPAKREHLKQQFQDNQPCRHVVIQNFLTDEAANLLFAHFPAMSEMNLKRKSMNEDKVEDYHFERFHPVFSKLREALSSAELTGFMQTISGIDQLITTTDAYGSGLSQGGNGSFIDVHIDFNMHTEQKLHRRLNLLLYLSKDWKKEYGGELEFWNKEVSHCERTYTPDYNTAILFVTDDTSPHGVRKVICPNEVSRKVFFTHYYTPIGENFVYHDSRFKSKPDESWMRRSVVSTKESLKVNAKRLLRFLGVKHLDFQDKN